MLELTRITVARIDENPALVQTGLDNVERWTRQNGGTLSRAYAEWQAPIRRHPWPELRRMLLEESEEGLIRVHEACCSATARELCQVSGGFVPLHAANSMGCALGAVHTE